MDPFVRADRYDPYDCPMLVSLGNGLRTTVHVAEYATERYGVRVARLPDSTPLLAWCHDTGIEEALVGGFYVRDPRRSVDPTLGGKPLGLLQIDGRAADSVPFDPPWTERRACLQASDGEVRIARRDELPLDLAGDVLQAGPILVRDGKPAQHAEEGFTEGSEQFDSDITIGRHPRAAFGIGGGRLIAVATEGRTETEAGLTLDELARVMVGLGAQTALNLDGGGSTSMIRAGNLRNVPREGDGTEIDGGRPIATALTFLPR